MENKDPEEAIIEVERDIVVERSPDGRFERLNDEISTQAFKTVYRGIDTENGNEVA